MNEVLEKPEFVGVVVCKLQAAEKDTVNLYELLLSSKVEDNKNQIKNEIAAFEQLLRSDRKDYKELLAEIKREEERLQTQITS